MLCCTRCVLTGIHCLNFWFCRPLFARFISNVFFWEALLTNLRIFLSRCVLFLSRKSPAPDVFHISEFFWDTATMAGLAKIAWGYSSKDIRYRKLECSRIPVEVDTVKINLGNREKSCAKYFIAIGLTIHFLAEWVAWECKS